MQTEEILKLLAPWKKKNTRAAWIPLIEEKDAPATDSKFGGLPWLDESAPWPNRRSESCSY